MRCPNCRIVMIANRGGLRCPKCDFLHKVKDLRMYNTKINRQ